MATRTFCDICEQELPIKRLQLMALGASGVVTPAATIINDFGEVCVPCAASIVKCAQGWKDDKIAEVEKAKADAKAIIAP
jgi:hypothetical protein